MGRFGKFLAAGLLAVPLALTGLPVAQAIDEPENVISYRRNVMKAMGAHIAAIAAVAKGEVGYIDQVEGHAVAMAALSDMIPTLFPEGTDKGDTKALPAVWADADNFHQSARGLSEALPALLAAGRDKDAAAVAKALGGVGQSCKGCHDDFRQADE